VIEEDRLKKALLSVIDYQISHFPEPSEQDRKIARRLRPRIKRMIEKKESPFMFYSKQIAALIVLLLGIMGLVLFGTNDSVRAGATRWLREQFESNIYRYQNQPGENFDITNFSLQEMVPQDYQFIDRLVDDNSVNEFYVNADGAICSFTVMNPAYKGDVYIVSDAEKRSVNIGRFQADIYLSNDISEGNEIVWRGEGEALFIIQGFFSETDLVELAEQINKLSE